MESLKTLFELQQMADQLDIPILQHYFRTFKPSEDKNLKAAIKNFHARGDLESADYRSAYHQLCDWFYGWDVSNAATTAAAAGGASNLLAQDVSADPTEEFSLKRVAREINLNEAGEKVECERIMKTFETLFGLSKRMLKRIYLQIEDMTPRIGQGLATMSNKQDENEEREDELKKEDVWKHERNETDDADNNHAEDTAEEDISGSFDDIRQQRAVDGLVVKKGDANSGEDTRRNTIFEKPPSTDRDSPHSSRSSSPSSDIDRGIDEKPRNSIVKNSTSTNSGPSKGFEFSPASHPDTPQVRRGLLQDGPNAFDLKSSMQRDINLCYGAVNKSLDYLLVCASNIILVLSFAEVLEMKDIFQKYNALAHDLSIEFVSNSLKTVWDLLNRELSDMNLAELRDPSLLKQRLKQIIEMNITYLKGNRNPRHKFRILHKKFELIHALFTAVDIHLFPNFIAAHKDGVKCAQFSAFDSNLWLTGGYDCIIRIHDLRPANNHICLSQYVGHKSIVTDVHFTKDDTHIVSCSFDRTIKIWNSQSASCERTLVGHTDSVMSCDVTTGLHPVWNFNRPDFAHWKQISDSFAPALPTTSLGQNCSFLARRQIHCECRLRS
ncbi:hypothetical protein BC830DRAFT_1093484 [Chytriomyces sp. MP71]|nr:hypothetical protein BC830DRAFT_1093484 [Chytriomyces sp. MP71]